MCPVGAASAGYLAGLSCALAANMYHLTINGVQGQPALLYLVPLTIGPVSLLAYLRGELPRLWSGEALLPATQRSLRPVGAAGGAADEARSRRSGVARLGGVLASRRSAVNRRSSRSSCAVSPPRRRRWRGRPITSRCRDLESREHGGWRAGRARADRGRGARSLGARSVCESVSGGGDWGNRLHVGREEGRTGGGYLAESYSRFCVYVY